jgi:hypothetical protein
MRKPQKPQSGKPVTVGHLNKAPPEYKSTALCYNNPLGVNFWDVTSAPTLWKNLLPPSYSLKMEAACSFKIFMSVCQTPITVTILNLMLIKSIFKGKPKIFSVAQSFQRTPEEQDPVDARS